MKTRKKIVREKCQLGRKGTTYCTISTVPDIHHNGQTPATQDTQHIKGQKEYEKTRSLEARWALTSSWRPFGPKGSVDQEYKDQKKKPKDHKDKD